MFGHSPVNNLTVPTLHVSPFLRDNPEVRLQLELSDHLISLSTEGFDLAIRHSATAPDTHVAWNFCDTATVIVSTRAYLRRSGTPLSPGELVGHNRLFYPRAQEVPAWTFEQTHVRKSAADYGDSSDYRIICGEQ